MPELSHFFFVQVIPQKFWVIVFLINFSISESGIFSEGSCCNSPAITHELLIPSFLIQFEKWICQGIFLR